MAGHGPLLIVLIVGNLLAFLLNQVLSLFGNLGEIFGQLPRIYPNTMSNISSEQFLEITPSSATFSIWAPIYVWQALWMIYSLANICRKTSTGPVYTNPILLTHGFFIVSILNWCFVIGWTFFWSYKLVWIAFVCLFLTAFTIYTMIGLSYRALANHEETLIGQKRLVDAVLIRMLVQNGLTFYGAWCTIATLLNLASALTYDVYPKYDQSTSSTIALAILSVELVVYVITDWTILEKYSRYTLSPYVVVVVALAGSMNKNWNPSKTNSIFTAVLLGVASVSFLIKALLTVYRHVRSCGCGRAKVFTPTTEKPPLGRP